MNNKTLASPASALHFAIYATWLNAALIPAATDSVLPTPKCMKNGRVAPSACDCAGCFYAVFFECGDPGLTSSAT